MAFHPFVNGIGAGTLPLDRFRHFITQDYVYLIDFARCLALAAAKAPDLPTMAWFARSVDYILNTEMELHRSYCAQFGITAAELDATRPAPTCYSYTSYLLRVAHQGSFGELVAALLPCIWGYWQVGERLADAGAPDHPGYAEWIAMYAGPEQQAVAEECRAICDRVAATAGPGGNRRHERGLHHLHPLRASILGNGLDAGNLAGIGTTTGRAGSSAGSRIAAIARRRWRGRMTGGRITGRQCDGLRAGRGGQIRTADLLLPKQAPCR